MCREFFALRELDDVLVYILKRLPGIGNDAGFLDKIIHAKRREELRRTVGRKHMIRSRKVVAERLGGIFADKDAPALRIFVITSNGFFVTSSRCSDAISLTVAIASSRLSATRMYP